MTPAEVLRKAADLIEERGWWNGATNKTGLCAGIAIGRACRQEQRLELPVTRLFAHAVTSCPTTDLLDACSAVYAWNDAQPNGEVVIAKLRQVADELEPTR